MKAEHCVSAVVWWSASCTLVCMCLQFFVYIVSNTLYWFLAVTDLISSQQVIWYSTLWCHFAISPTNWQPFHCVWLQPSGKCLTLCCIHLSRVLSIGYCLCSRTNSITENRFQTFAAGCTLQNPETLTSRFVILLVKTLRHKLSVSNVCVHCIVTLYSSVILGLLCQF